MIQEIVEGASEPLYIGLRNNGDPIPHAHSFDVAISITRKGETEELPEEQRPTVEWDGTEDECKVKVTGHESLPTGNYHVRFVLTDADENVGHCPNGQDADLWIVRSVHARRANAV